ncbi:MAG: PDR/VanB family oxidoreductase [Rhodobacteraceae bacterium]|nr:PDR/VanB family oxidoreductase [Paracoccaceae bacterium]
MLKLTVTDIRDAAPGVRQICLADKGALLPGFDAGAHIRIDVPDVGPREYSLINLDPKRATQDGVTSYDLGVRLEDDSTGGSVFMHALTPGAEVMCAPPRNDFPLAESPNPLLIAGGIGITPIATMAAYLAGQELPFDLHYSGREQGSLAFLDALKKFTGQKFAANHLTTHYDNTDTALDLGALLRTISPARDIYVCGPGGMIEATKAAAAQAGFDAGRVHFELFARATPKTGDVAFEVEIASTGDVHTIPADQSIIEALEAAGLDLMYDCQRGDCGICQTDVVSGIPDHRDVVLSDDEKSAGEVMQICVSRAKSERLVLDI